MESVKVGDFGAEIKNIFFTDGLDTCHFIFVSICAEYADNNFLTLSSHQIKVVSDYFEVHFNVSKIVFPIFIGFNLF